VGKGAFIMGGRGRRASRHFSDSFGKKVVHSKKRKGL